MIRPQIEKGWWKNFFDRFYLMTDARSVSDIGLTKFETDAVIDLMGLRENDSILDLCGGSGRHSLELASRGYSGVCIVDYSSYLIDICRKEASRRGLGLDIRKGDARNTGLASSSLDAVFMIGGSFGTFLEEEDDIRLLKEAYRVLKPGSAFLFDITDRKRFLSGFMPFSCHDTGQGSMVYRMRRREGRSVVVREAVVSSSSGSIIRDRCYMKRIYPRGMICSMMRGCGFSAVRFINGPFDYRREGDYGFLTSRTAVLSKKM